MYNYVTRRSEARCTIHDSSVTVGGKGCIGRRVDESRLGHKNVPKLPSPRRKEPLRCLHTSVQIGDLCV